LGRFLRFAKTEIQVNHTEVRRSDVARAWAGQPTLPTNVPPLVSPDKAGFETLISGGGGEGLVRGRVRSLTSHEFKTLSFLASRNIFPKERSELLDPGP